jgi:hypothetical protein
MGEEGVEIYWDGVSVVPRCQAFFSRIYHAPETAGLGWKIKMRRRGCFVNETLPWQKGAHFRCVKYSILACRFLQKN